MILNTLYMARQKIKKKLVFIGDVNSINIELVLKSFSYLKNKVFYILICNKNDLFANTLLKKTRIKINEVYDPIGFTDYKKNFLNIFNIENQTKKKYLNLLNQIKICNNLANLSRFDLVTMPINKSVFKKNIVFNGMTEYLGLLNNRKTLMLMHGENFSIIPLTTHINIKNVHKFIRRNFLNNFCKNILLNLKNNIYKLNFKNIKFLCYNPHCGEEGTLGKEDILIKNVIKNHKEINGIFAADSAFNNLHNNTLFISTYHDQALIPFKTLNKNCLNLTLGLNYRRLSPAHGTAVDIKKKNIADNTSYLKCLLF